MPRSDSDGVCLRKARFAVLCPPEVLAWLDSVAAAEDRSRNYVVMRILRAAMVAATAPDDPTGPEADAGAAVRRSRLT